MTLSFPAYEETVTTINIVAWCAILISGSGKINYADTKKIFRGKYGKAIRVCNFSLANSCVTGQWVSAG
jgi:hypothetical protein